MNSKIKVLVTAVGAPPGRNVVRALAEKKDINIIAAEHDSLIPVLYNRKETSAAYLLPKAEEESKFIGALTKIVKKEKIKVILPCIENEIFVLSKYKDYFLRKGIVIACPFYHNLKKLADKLLLSRLANKLKIPAPKTFLFSEFIKNPQAFNYPAIIKPRIGYGAKNIRILDKLGSIKELAAKFRGEENKYVVQEYIPGSTGSIFMCGLLYTKDNKPYAEFLSRSIKTLYPIGGPAVCGESLRGFTRIRNYSKKLVESAGGWFGPLGVEYKVSDRDGIPYLMEVNPRFWGYGLLAVKSGLNFPYLAVMKAIGREVKIKQHYKSDTVLLRETNDIVIKRTELKKPANYKEKIICVYCANFFTEKAIKAIKALRLLKKVDKIILTGEKELLKRFVKSGVTAKNAIAHVQQVEDEYENLYEISLHNFADLVLVIKQQKIGIEINKVNKALDGISSKNIKHKFLGKDFYIVKSDFLKDGLWKK